MKRMFGWLVVVTMCSMLVSAVCAQDKADLPKPVGSGKAYYMAENGADAADGSKATPWKTFVKANTVVKPGDVVYVQPGHYDGGNFTARGTAEAPIVYASAEKHKAVVDGFGKCPFKDNEPYTGNIGHRVLLSGDYTHFIGFDVSACIDPDKPDRKGGKINAGVASYRSRGIVVRDNHIHDNDRWSIFTKEVTGMIIENNICHGNRREHGIYHADGSKDCILRGNICYDNGGCGIQLNQGGTDMPYENVLIEGNLLYDNNKSGGQTVNMDGGCHAVIRNNIFIVNRRHGIALYKGDGNEPAHDNVIVNNLFLLEEGARGGILLNDAGENTIFNHWRPIG